MQALWLRLGAAVAGCLLSLAASAAVPRSAAAKAEFQRINPCPSTGRTRGACPGYVKDHIVPLCAGGADRPHNMQWQTVSAAKRKDRDERRQCNVGRRR